MSGRLLWKETNRIKGKRCALPSHYSQRCFVFHSFLVAEENNWLLRQRVSGESHQAVSLFNQKRQCALCLRIWYVRLTSQPDQTRGVVFLVLLLYVDKFVYAVSIVMNTIFVKEL